MSWQLPTWIESFVLVGALSRLGAVQNPILPIYRKREVALRAPARPRPTCSIVPSNWRGLRLRGDGQRSAPADVDDLEVLTADKRLPEGDPGDAAGPPIDGDDPVRWLFYTSGTTADPKGAQHTDATIMATAIAMDERLAAHRDDRSGLVFPFTHIGGITWLFSTLLEGVHDAFWSRRSTRPTTPPSSAARERDARRLGHHVPHGLPRGPAGRPRRRYFPKVRGFPGRRRAEAAAAPLRPQERDRRRRHRVGLRPDRGADPHHGERHRQRRRRSPRPRAERCRGVQAPRRDARRRGRRHRRGGRDPGQGAAADEGLPRPVARRRGVRRGRAASAPATSA